MSRSNPKEIQLKDFAEIILSNDDYTKIIQKLNGKRAGLQNQLRHGKAGLDGIKRLDSLKRLVEAFK